MAARGSARISIRRPLPPRKSVVLRIALFRWQFFETANDERDEVRAMRYKNKWKRVIMRKEGGWERERERKEEEKKLRMFGK